MHFPDRERLRSLMRMSERDARGPEKHEHSLS